MIPEFLPLPASTFVTGMILKFQDLVAFCADVVRASMSGNIR